MSLYEDLSGLTDGPHIRVLLLYANENIDAPIRFSLETHPLESPREYEALSYVWGDPSDAVTARYKSQDIRIGRNLVIALQYLRRRDSARILWVDALCINQSDFRERASQVLLMGQIYRTAKSTIIWLGEPRERSYEALGLCEKLARVPLQLEWSKTEENSHVLSQREDIALLYDLLARPWWTRAWVIQELCVSENPIFTIGHKSISYETWNHVMELVREKYLSLDMGLGRLVLVQGEWRSLYALGNVAAQTPEQQRTLDGLRDISILTEGVTNFFQFSKTREDIQNKLEPPSLIDNLVRFRYFQATDPRDKVYSILGLSKKLKQPLVVGYEISVAECYVKTAFAIISSTSRLDILNISNANISSHKDGLPTWAPYWNPDKSKFQLGLRPIRQYADMLAEREPGVPETLEFRPTSHEEVLTLDLLPSNTLVLSGSVVDEVLFTRRTMEWLSLPFTSAEMWDGLSWSHIPSWVRTLFRLGVAVDVVLEWHQLCSIRYLTRLRRSSDLAWLACVGQGQSLESPESALSTLENLHALLREAKVVRLLASPFRNGELIRRLLSMLWIFRICLRFVSFLYYLLMGIAMTAATQFRLNCWGEEKDKFFRLHNRTFVLTVKGYIGVVPGHCDHGDVIALLPGGNRPYILRPVGSQFRFIGPCYIDGIMFGEAWKTEDCTSLSIC